MSNCSEIPARRHQQLGLSPCFCIELLKRTSQLASAFTFISVWHWIFPQLWTRGESVTSGQLRWLRYNNQSNLFKYNHTVCSWFTWICICSPFKTGKFPQMLLFFGETLCDYFYFIKTHLFTHTPSKISSCPQRIRVVILGIKSLCSP